MTYNIQYDVNAISIIVVRYTNYIVHVSNNITMAGYEYTSHHSHGFNIVLGVCQSQVLVFGTFATAFFFAFF